MLTTRWPRRPPAWRRFAGDENGGVALLSVLLATMMVGMLALAVEVGLWYTTKRELQTAADAGAMAAAIELALDNTSSYAAVAIREAMRNGAGENEIEVNAPPKHGLYPAKSAEVLVSRQVQTLFASLFMNGDVNVHARGVGNTKADAEFCVLALHPTASGALDASGNGTVALSGCNIAVDSSSASAFSLGGSSHVQVEEVDVVGDITGASGHLFARTTRLHAPPVPDPYADTEVPAANGACTTPHFSHHHSETLQPGHYCTLTVQNGEDVTLQPGVYVIRDSLEARGGILRGEGVTLVFARTVSAVILNGGATVALKAPTSGSTAGLVMFGDPAATSADIRLNGGSTTSLSGAVYFPSQAVQFNGNTGSGAATCTQLIARTIAFTGDSTLSNDCAAAGTRNIGHPKPRLVD